MFANVSIEKKKESEDWFMPVLNLNIYLRYTLIFDYPIDNIKSNQLTSNMFLTKDILSWYQYYNKGNSLNKWTFLLYHVILK